MGAGIRSMPVRISPLSTRLISTPRALNLRAKTNGKAGDACRTSTAAARRPRTCPTCGGAGRARTGLKKPTPTCTGAHHHCLPLMALARAGRRLGAIKETAGERLLSRLVSGAGDTPCRCGCGPSAGARETIDLFHPELYPART